MTSTSGVQVRVTSSESIPRRSSSRDSMVNSTQRRCIVADSEVEEESHSSDMPPARKRPRDDSAVVRGTVKEEEVDALEGGHLQETTTSKGKKALVRDGYVYLLNKKTPNGRTYWICRHKGCAGRVNQDPVGAVTKRTGHSHSPVPEEVQELVFKSMLKEMVKEDKAPVKEVYASMKKQYVAVHGVESSLPSFKEVKGSLYRAREVREDSGECPTSVDLVLRVGELSTIVGDPWLVADDDIECEDDLQRLLVFADNFMLQLLSRSLEWWIDGSFSSSPKHFRQLYTVFCSVEGEVFPVVYGLLPSTSTAIYQCFFCTIKAKLACLGCPTRGPDIIHSDFEQGALSAVAQEFPSARVVGRYFHLAHDNYKHVKTFLDDGYLQDARLRSRIRQLWALAMLPHGEVESAFEELAAEFPDDDAGAVSYVNYFRTTWIQGPFAPELWNVSCIKNRVNSAVEMWHRRLNCALENTAKTFHRFLSRLKKEQHLARTSASALHDVAAPRPRHRRDVETELKLNQAKNAYDSNRMSRGQYLQRCALVLRKCI